MAEPINEELHRLHKADLTKAGAGAVLGMIVARQLLEFGQSSIYLDDEGYVAVASPGELSLDALPEPMAIQTLTSQDWNEDEVITYLRGRDARFKSGG